VTFRILVTGSRSWDDSQTIANVLSDYYSDPEITDITLVSGNCPEGADMICENYAEFLGWTVERYPAVWEQHGRKAGYLRNYEMVKLGADVCLVFIRDNSRGASMTAELAEKNGIETRRFDYKEI